MFGSGSLFGKVGRSKLRPVWPSESFFPGFRERVLMLEKPPPQQKVVKLGGGNSNIFDFHPLPGETIPNLTSIFFKWVF